MYRKAHTLLIVAAAVTALQVLAPYVQCQRSVRRPLIRAPRGAPTTDRYIVVLKGEEDLQQVVAQVLDVSEAGQVYEKIENVLIVKLSAEALETVRKIPQVHYIEEEDLAEGAEGVDTPWYLDRLDQVYLPLDRSYNPQGSGEGIDIYILDTGINYDHNEFEYRAKYAGYDPVDQNLRMIEGYIPRRGYDCHGHGTHVASLCGGKTYGVAKKVSLYSVRVLGCDNRAPWGVVLDGLNYVASVIPQRGRRAVVMMTLSGSHHQSVSDVIASLHGLGVPVVVPAGNRQSDACLYSPASAPHTITVGATNITDGLYDQSNYGACVDLFAPGDLLLAAGYNCSSCTAIKSGTSQATALVAGVAALYLEGLPLLAPDQLKEKLTQQAVDTVIGVNGIPENFRSLTPNRLLNIGLITECGGNVYTTDTPVAIHSPHYPMNYPNNLKCVWTVTSKIEQQVEIKFNYIMLEENYDTITVCDGEICNLTNTIAELSGSLGKTGCSYTSSGQTLTLVMLSDSTVAAPGFIASFTTAKYDKSNGRRGFKGCSVPDTSLVQFDVKSAGWYVGNQFSMMKDWEELFGGRLRGMNVAILKASTGEVVLTKNFDTWESGENSDNLAAAIEHATPGHIVLVAVSDEATRYLNTRAKRALRALGSQKIHHLGYRDSWAMVGIKGIAPGNAIEHLNNFAPAEISTHYKLQASEKLGVQISAKSAGYSVGNFAEISIDGEVITISQEGYNRGLNVIIIDERNGAVLHKEIFDTSASEYTGIAQADAFANLIHSLPSGRIVAIAAKEDAVEALTDSAKEACESIGSTLIRQIQYRGSWAFIGRKGGSNGNVAEVGSNTEPVESTFWLPAVSVQDSVKVCSIAVSSRGLSTDIAVNQETLDDRQRGITVVTLEDTVCAIDESATFDTHGSTSASDALAAFITKIPPGRIVAATVCDEASTHLTEKAKLALESIGSILIRRLTYRGAWAIVGRKGAAPGSVPEVMNPNSAAIAAVQRLRDRYVTSVMVQSAGFLVGNYYNILVNEQRVPISCSRCRDGCGDCRGMNVVVLDESSGNVLHENDFDTHGYTSRSEAFASFINSLANGAIIVIAIKDEAKNRLTESAMQAIESLGSNLIRQIQYRGSWAMVSKKGDERALVEAGSNTAAVQVTSWIPKDPSLSNDCIIAVHSSGFGKGLNTQITVKGTKTQNGYGRGITVAIVDETTCITEKSTSFDTHASTSQADNLAELIMESPTGRIIVATVWDSGSVQLTENAKLALQSIGSAQIRNLGHRDAWAIIGQKGLPPGSVPEVLHPSSASLEARVRLSDSTCEDAFYKLNCLAVKESSILA